MMKLTDCDIAGKRLLIREDFNAPIKDGRVSNTSRIDAALPTLKYALDKGAYVFVVAHLGRPTEGQFDPAFSLEPVRQCLQEKLGCACHLVSSIEEPLPLNQGELVLIENIRFFEGEKGNSPILSEKLAALCDIYVNDAFAVSHREQASTHGVALKAPIACAGPLLVQEVEALDKAIKHPQPPIVAIVGGAKVSTKFGVLKSLLERVDTLVVGGGMANTFLKAKGLEIGASLCEDDWLEEAQALMAFADQNQKHIFLPEDVVVAKEMDLPGQIKELSEIQRDDKIFDIGPKAQQTLTTITQDASTIIWNGPVGVFEVEAFSKGTHALAKAIQQSSAFSLAGGGDTLAAIDTYDIRDDISYISTGGGAFLEYLEGNSLPGILILEKSKETS